MNQQTIDNFLDYCKKNPDQRFWQALTKWGGFLSLGCADNSRGDNYVDLWHAQDKFTGEERRINERIYRR